VGVTAGLEFVVVGEEIWSC